MADYILQMNKEIREKTAYFIAFNLFLFVFLLAELGVLPRDTLRNVSLLSSIFAAGFSILYFVGDFYRVIEDILLYKTPIVRRLFGRVFKDNKKYYTTKRIDQYIFNNLTKSCRRETCPVNEAIREKDENDELKKADFSHVMSLFYTFIPPDQTERERSFAYFIDYYLAINYFIISIMFAILSFATLIVTTSITYIVHIITTINITTFMSILGVPFIYTIIAIFSLILWMRYSPRLIEPTENQIREILTHKKTELISLLPSYRVYKIIDKNGSKQQRTCAESKKCPLMKKRRNDYHDFL